jgi:hypothetical protein
MKAKPKAVRTAPFRPKPLPHTISDGTPSEISSDESGSPVEMKIIRDPAPGSSEAVVPMMVPLLALSPNGCRWPYGDHGYVFCNHTRYSDSSYCQEHYRASLREFAG